MQIPDRYRSPETETRIGRIAASFARLLGRPLVTTGQDAAAALWQASAAIVAHGTEDDPLFFFANRAALAAFDCPLDRFIGMPSRLSAEAPLREERQALLDRVTAHGFIDDYAGVRIQRPGGASASTARSSGI